MAEAVNSETPLKRQRDLLTSNEDFYHRNNFPYPERPKSIEIGGAVERPFRLVAQEIARLDERTFVVTLECAGNGRAFLDPPVEGEQWRLGAVGTAEFTGAMLGRVLDEAGVLSSAAEVVFYGADGFARSLPVEVARRPDTLLATHMNQEPLPDDHGGPVRLVVPGWYGMASVKWLARIEVAERPFEGHFQVERYVVDGQPLREMEVRAVITEPVAGAEVSGQVPVAGYAWTGHGQVARVELSDDGGETWWDAPLVSEVRKHAWSRWATVWSPRAPGPASLLARATDTAGRVQPLEQRWNELGYANNAAIPQSVTVSRTA